MIKLVIFDMDGLMVDSEALAYDIWNKVLSEFNIQFSLEEYCGYIGYSDEEIAQNFIKAFPDIEGINRVPDDVARLLFEACETKPVPTKAGLFELFDFLEQNGIKKAVASSSPTAHAENILNNCGVLQRMDFKIYGDMVKRAKPDPELFLKTVEHFGFEKNECLVLEDSKQGIEAATLAKIPVICVKDLIVPENISDTVMMAESLFEVIDYIKQRNDLTTVS